MSQEHSLNLGNHEQSYIDAFNLIMALNPCPTLQTLKVVSTATCKNFSDGIVAQGMAVAISKHFENIRRVLEIFTNINSKVPTLNGSEYASFYNITQNMTYNYIINLFNSNLKIQTSLVIFWTFHKIKLLETMQDIYLKNTLRYLLDNFQVSIQTKADNILTKRVAIFICFNVILFFAFFAFWIPLLSKLQKDVFIKIIWERVKMFW